MLTPMARRPGERREEPDGGPTDQRPGWARLHLWQIQWVRDVLVVLGVLGLFTLGSRLSIVTVPILLAMLFAYLLEPVVGRLERLERLGRRGAVITLLVATTVLVVVPTILGAVFGGIQLVQLASRIGRQAGAVIASVDSPDDAARREAVQGEAWLWVRDLVVEVQQEAARLEAGEPAAEEPGGVEDEDLLPVDLFGIDEGVLAQAFLTGLEWVRAHAPEIGQAALSTGRGAVTVAVATVGSLARLAFGAFLTAFFFFFMSWRWGAVREHMRELLPERNRERTVEIVGKMDRAIAGFVRGRLTIAFFLSIFYAVGFWLIGVPAPLVLGPAIAFLAIIPYAPVLGLPVVIVLLLLEQHTGFRDAWWWAVFAPILYYNIGQALDDYVLTPSIQGQSTGLDAPAILFASIAGGVLMGFFGLLVAIPIAACVKILLTEVFWPRFEAWTEGRRRDFLPIDGDG
jgi:predicted PurR-regulated permease PerM